MMPLVPTRPGVEHHLGLDRETGELFHLHVYYRLVLDGGAAGDYRLRLEPEILDSARRVDGVRVPAPEMELAVLVLRLILAYRDRDGLKDALGRRSPGVKQERLEELRALREATSATRLRIALANVGRDAPGRIVLEFLEVIDREPRDALRLFLLRRRLRRWLRGDRLPPEPRTAPRIALVGRDAQRAGPSARRRTLPAGGRSIALVGTDGAGKSTMAASLADWLGWKLWVEASYLGSKQPSRRSRVLYAAYRASRRGERAISRMPGARGPAHVAAAIREVLLDGHRLSLAVDRYRRYAQARRSAARGSIVIHDRYPLAALIDDLRQYSMDGPRIEAGGARSLRGAMARAERRLYGLIEPPDHTFVLRVTPSEAIRRKPDHDSALIAAKHEAIAELLERARTTSHGRAFREVDADQPFDDLLREVKSDVWDIL
jgi:thymidylate kinase